MIDVSQIHDLNELKEMKDALNFFINKKIVADIYREEGKEKIELDVDRGMARELLEQVSAQMRRLNPQASKRDSKPPRRVPSKTF